ncbi:MAG: hypothetical protein ACI97N_000965, partial [Cognaticolwellia sp.]
FCCAKIEIDNDRIDISRITFFIWITFNNEFSYPRKLDTMGTLLN